MPGIEELRLLAVQARDCAYAPYSNHPVGAALRTPAGSIYKGCNVENAAYPVGSCAETSAIAAMIAGGERRIEEMVIIGPGESPCTPCGACRQRIREFAGPNTKIHSFSADGKYLTLTLEELLPQSFGPEHLG